MTTIFILFLIVLVLVLFAMVCLLAARIEWLMHENHLDCHDHAHALLARVNHRAAADALRAAADRWDSVEETRVKDTLARKFYKPGGPSMPAIWLRHEADRLQALDPIEEQLAAQDEERETVDA